MRGGLCIYLPLSGRRNRSGNIVSPRQISIDKTNDWVMNSEQETLVRGSNPFSGHSVRNTEYNTGRAPARCDTKTFVRAVDGR